MPSRRHSEDSRTADYVSELHSLNRMFEYVERGVYARFSARHPALPSVVGEKVRDFDDKHMECVENLDRDLERNIAAVGLKDQKRLAHLFNTLNEALEGHDNRHFDFVLTALHTGRDVGSISSQLNDYGNQCVRVIPLYASMYMRRLSELNERHGLGKLNAYLNEPSAGKAREKSR